MGLAVAVAEGHDTFLGWQIHKQENVVAVDRTHALCVAHCAVEDETAREDGRFEANHAQRQSKARAPGREKARS